MTTSSSSPSSSARALVLGGGGAAGNAWTIGVLAGLADGGLDPTLADLVIGTSSGSTAAAQLTSGAHPSDLLAATLAPTSASRRAPGMTPAAVGTHLERTDRIIADAADADDMRRRMGAAFIAIDDANGGEHTARWRAVVEARLPGLEWPGRSVLVTAVDAETGDPVVFDRSSGIHMVDAIAASTSGGAAYRIGTGRYFDGGYRRNENADLAADSERVLVLSPFGGRTRHPLSWRMQLSAQLEELRAGGSEVETVFPDAAALAAFGGGMMDTSSRPAAARAGHALGRATAERLAGFWT